MPIMSCSLLSMSPSLTRAAHSAASCNRPAAASSSALCFPSGSLPMILNAQFSHHESPYVMLLTAEVGKHSGC